MCAPPVFLPLFVFSNLSTKYFSNPPTKPACIRQFLLKYVPYVRLPLSPFSLSFPVSLHVLSPNPPFACVSCFSYTLHMEVPHFSPSFLSLYTLTKCFPGLLIKLTLMRQMTVTFSPSFPPLARDKESLSFFSLPPDRILILV